MMRTVCSSERVCTFSYIYENRVGNITLGRLIAPSPDKSIFDSSGHFDQEEFEWFPFVPPYEQQSGQFDSSHLDGPKCKKPVPTHLAN